MWVNIIRANGHKDGIELDIPFSIWERGMEEDYVSNHMEDEGFNRCTVCGSWCERAAEPLEDEPTACAVCAQDRRDEV